MTALALDRDTILRRINGIQQELRDYRGDIEQFLASIKRVLEHPERFGIASNI